MFKPPFLSLRSTRAQNKNTAYHLKDKNQSDYFLHSSKRLNKRLVRDAGMQKRYVYVFFNLLLGALLTKNIAFTKDQLLELARKDTPKFVEVDIEERPEGFTLVLRMKPMSPYRYAIYRYPAQLRSKMVEELKEKIEDFGESIANGMIKSFGLNDKFEEKYRDRNIVYKVNKWYQVRKGYTTNLENYYNEKARKTVHLFQRIWELFVKEPTIHDKAEEITDYLHGANERLKQLIFAKDRISDIIVAKPSGNDTWFLVNFYVFHFISLLKSLGDNLAWLIKLYCHMNMDEKKTDLAMKGFENTLKSINNRLHRCIYGDVGFVEYRRLKEFRDIVHHKHALHVEQVKLGFKGSDNVMIPIDPKSGLIIDGKRYRELKYPKLAEASDRDGIAKYGLKSLHVWTGPNNEIPWQNPVDFCTKFIEIMGKFYNAFYERMALELRRKPIGKVQKYFQRIGVGVIALTDDLVINDRIQIEGATTSFVQPVLSIEIEKKRVESAKAGQKIGLKVDYRVRKGDVVFKLSM